MALGRGWYTWVFFESDLVDAPEAIVAHMTCEVDLCGVVAQHLFAGGSRCCLLDTVSMVSGIAAAGLQIPEGILHTFLLSGCPSCA